MSDTTHRLYRIAVAGVVQGVGFRPFVYNLAARLGLKGWVLNHSGGVTIEVEGPTDRLDALVAALRAEAPPMARIESLTFEELPPAGHTGFEIRSSEEHVGAYQLVSPDTATCADCLHEVLDRSDRRYRYPFTNCTNCGPRFTIITSLPYDRQRTTMRAFRQCPDCQREYENPADRRFHAQPNACPVCGPRLSLIAGNARPAVGAGLPPDDGPDAVARAARMLREGAVLAIKGLGGFQLACDATNARTVAALRARKQRPHKPFAVMVTDLAAAREHCSVSAAEERLLSGPEAPIVLLPWRDSSSVAWEVAPDQCYLGVMLPYTPLHHLLLRDAGCPLVMTSGNLSEEPIAAQNDEAMERLAPLADAFLLHDRAIEARYDDSVWFVPEVAGEPAPQPVRRARGYAPYPVRLPFEGIPLLACGAHLKNTFCLARDHYAFLSQHIGDLENLETLEHWERALELYRRLFDVQPAAVAVDLHPDYIATRLGRELAAREGLPVVQVQHHHAHLAACLADSGWRPEDGLVIGVCLDGTGYGTDGHIWGGEWLVGNYSGFQRHGALEYLPLPGGDSATRHPWRTAAGYALALLDEIPAGVIPAEAPDGTADVLRQQVRRGLNAPLTSSMGRLFDAVAALVGVGSTITYEAQAAIALEMLATRACRADESSIGEGYPFDVELVGGLWTVRLAPLFIALLGDVARRENAGLIARRFHRTVQRMTVALCLRIADETAISVVALTGGCFQNRLLLSEASAALRAQGLRVLVHRQVPANDGGLSLGQAAVARMNPMRSTQDVPGSSSPDHVDRG